MSETKCTCPNRDPDEDYIHAYGCPTEYGCHLADIPGHDCALDPCEPAEAVIEVAPGEMEWEGPPESETQRERSEYAASQRYPQVPAVPTQEAPREPRKATCKCGTLVAETVEGPLHHGPWMSGICGYDWAEPQAGAQPELQHPEFWERLKRTTESVKDYPGWMKGSAVNERIPQAGAQDERWQRIYNSCNPGSATRELIDELRALKAALSKARETLIDHQLHADGRIVKALDIVRSALFATPLGAQVPRVGIIDTPENRIRYRDRIAAQVPSLVKLGLDYRAVVAKHPGGFPEGRLAEIDAALGAQVPSRCTTYDDVTTEEANNGEERARQIIKTMDAFDPLDALSTLYAIQFHLESRLAHIVSYATEAAKTPITRESILAAPQVDEAPIPENLKMDYGMYKKSGLGGPAELIERIAQLEAENRARKLTQLTQSDEMQGFCRLVLSEIGGGL